jgi:hypothetical protein
MLGTGGKMVTNCTQEPLYKIGKTGQLNVAATSLQGETVAGTL